MGKVKSFFVLQWQPMLTVVLGIALLVALLWYNLGTNTPGLSAIELQTVQDSATFSNLVANPLFLPFKLPLFVLQQLGYTSIFALRSVGAVYGLIAAVLFYIVLRQWHTKRIATIGAALFVTSSWFLQTSRLAAPYILYPLGIISLFVIFYWLYKSRHRKLVFLISSVVAVGSLYIPGMIWFVGTCFIWQLPQIKAFVKKLPIWVLFVVVPILLVLFAPLVYASIQNYHIALGFLGAPEAFMPQEWVKRLLVLPVFVLARGPLEPVLNLGRLPLLDIFSAAMAVLGVYWYSFKIKLLRTRLLSVFTFIAAILIMLNGVTMLPLLLPLSYIVITAGIMLLLQQWFTVFPRNPIARSLGIGIVCIAIGVTGAYHMRRYFVAWSGDPITKATFSYQLPANTTDAQ